MILARSKIYCPRESREWQTSEGNDKAAAAWCVVFTCGYYSSLTDSLEDELRDLKQRKHNKEGKEKLKKKQSAAEREREQQRSAEEVERLETATCRGARCVYNELMTSHLLITM